MGRIDVYNATDAPITTAEGIVVGGRERATVDEAAAGTPGLVDVTAPKKTDKTSSTSSKTTSSTTRKSASKGADDSQED